MDLLATVFLLSLSILGTRTSNFFTKNGDPLSIHGPNTFHDKIAVIGAGPSGIDMATRLKKMGFTSIDIYEREDRVGGKSMTTLDPQGTIQELGSCCIGPGYEENVIDIINNYAPPGSLVPRQFGSVWLDDKATTIPYHGYVMIEIMRHFETDSLEEAQMKLAELVKMYTHKHQQLFGTYEYELMPRPSKEALIELNCSYWTFLKRNGLEGLRPILLLTHTLQGYGYLDEIGAFYGLMWNTPFLMQSLLALASGKETPIRPYLLKIGFQKLWQSVVDAEGLNVKLKSRVTNVQRSSNGVIIHVNGDERHYDFLIWSPELKSSLKLFDPLWQDESNAFKSTNATFLTSSLIGLDGGRKAPTPTAYWMDNVIKKRNASVWATRNAKEAFEAGRTDHQNSEILSKKGVRDRYVIAYQYSPRRPCKPLLKALTHFENTGVTGMSLITQKVWKYFSHYSSKDLTGGVLWDILEMQGKHKTWYIGSSVSFESLKSVIEYNKLLLSLMKKPIGN